MGRVGLYAGAGVAFVVAVVLAAVGAGEAAGALTNWQALVLGVVQGFTEFLPISSSGHLILVPWLADWTYLEANDEFNQTFDVALHLGTLVAAVLYFWWDIVVLAKAFLASLRKRSVSTPNERAAWFVALATVPAVFAGALGESFIAEHLGEPWQIAILLGGFAVLLWLADRRPTELTIETMSFKDAIAIGFAQMLALAPGVSRSGVTITAARFLRLERDSAARFSFLLLIPITFGAVVFKGVSDVVLADLPPGSTGPFIVGTLAAAASGIFAIGALLGYVRRHTYTVFVVYRLLITAIVLLLIASGARAAGF
jgi:undecaprenyl-diphosphatase